MPNNKIHSVLVIVILFLAWEISFHLLNLKWYLLPPPSMILDSIFNNAHLLFLSPVGNLISFSLWLAILLGDLKFIRPT